jgi:ribosomal protein L37AE/L43A
VGSNERFGAFDYKNTRRRLEGKQTMIYFKACPKCNGDVEFVTLTDYKYLQCLMCGYYAASSERKVVYVK